MGDVDNFIHNSPSQDYSQPDDQIPPSYDMAPPSGLKQFLKVFIVFR